MHRGYDTPGVERSEHHLRVGMPAKRRRQRGLSQLAAQLFEVVDLAVEHRHVTSGGRCHRLMAGGRQVDDRQPAEPEGNAGVGVDPFAGVVGATMHERVGHPPHSGREIVRSRGRSDETGQPAHGRAVYTWLNLMLFHSFAFLVFLPIFMTFYWATTGRSRLWVMLLGSLVFYAWWDWRFLFLLLFSAVVDYSIGIAMENQADPAGRRRLIVMSIIINLGLLGFFKYFNFFVDSAAQVSTALGLHASYNALRIVLPVGISFYVFKTMSYTIDVYRRTQQAERDLLKFTTFVVFFPELVAGP